MPRPASRAEHIALAILLLYFVVRVVFLAAHVSPSLPPDEVDHFGLSRHHVAYLGLAQDTPASHPHGVIGHRPPLFHWAMGRALALRPAAIGELAWLRGVNGALALGTVLAGLAWLRAVGAAPLAGVLFVALLTNLPMWSFLSASVNYDNLAMCLATVAFAALAHVVRRCDARALLLLFAALGAGALTKLAFLPVAALLVLVVLVVAAAGGGRRARELAGSLAEHWRERRASTALLAALATLLCLGSAVLYGGNLIRFGVLSPAPNQVLELDEAKRNRIFLQEYVLRSYRAGAIDARAAAAELQQIEHAGDRAGALWMLRRAREMREGRGDALIGRAAYGARWISLMSERLFGVMGHRELYKGPAVTAGYTLLCLMGLGALVVCAWRPREGAPDPVQLRIAGLVFAAYALVLMQVVNYPIYRITGLEFEAVQGRYLFPVLAPLIAGASASVLALLPARARWPAAIAAAAFFVAFDFPYFLATADPVWLAAD